jgi:hypothetical protein
MIRDSACCSDCARKSTRLGATPNTWGTQPTGSWGTGTGSTSPVQCDQDGNCYQDGVLVSAPLTSSGGQVGNVIPPYTPDTSQQTTVNWTYIAGGAAAFMLGLFLIDSMGGGRRR